MAPKDQRKGTLEAYIKLHYVPMTLSAVIQ